MGRNFYTYASLLTVVLIASMVTQGVLYVTVGSRFFEAHAIFNWIIFSAGLNVAFGVCLLLYYWHRQYLACFWSLLIVPVTQVIHASVTYGIIRTHEISVLFIAATFGLILSEFIHAMSILLSRARVRIWLRPAGIYSLMHSLLLFFIFSRAFVSLGDRVNGSLERLDQWIGLAGALIPFFFLLNFISERRGVKDRENDIAAGYVGYAFLVAITCFIIFSPKLIAQSIAAGRDMHGISEWAKEVAKPFDARVFVNQRGDTLRYRLLIPLQYDSLKEYPLVIGLHGSSGCGTDNARQIATTLPALWFSEPMNRMRYPAFIFVPQCPQHWCWGGIEKVPAVDSLVIEAMASIEEEFSIDPSRRYLAGNSLGGYGAWHIAATWPELFAAVIPICGGGSSAYGKNLVNVPVWAFHGAKDRNVPVSGSRGIIEVIRQNGGDPKYTEFPDLAHDIGNAVLHTEGVWDWMFAQQKETEIITE